MTSRRKLLSVKANNSSQSKSFHDVQIYHGSDDTYSDGGLSYVDSKHSINGSVQERCETPGQVGGHDDLVEVNSQSNKSM